MIETFSLVKRYGPYLSLSYKDMAFETGKSYVMLGASGCGKSTYLNMIAGVISPSEGNIRIDGKDMTALRQSARDAFRIREIGYIFQDFKLIEEMTVEDNINILRLEKVDTSGMAEILDAVGILRLRKRKVMRLSGGEKQRVAIARALVKKPSIILADEPTGNLNYAIGRSVVASLLEASRGKTLICVTHDDRLSSMFDVVIDMNEIASSEEAGEEHV